ncbi:GspE/PulE family protein [Polynucleobacter sp. AP-Kolm-20A-A1]|uniref:GspE/PulE family protein n=1 Tax=Polynucleobacter sp. AP-Kolm-20A-A1 TaxID=2081041 RepID=UPI001BFE5889|nr:GspE/PulE family protein [Polynucleobacter sp. AP-Kolm-20A-A1]QWE21463.1 type II/IV secretion system protein [Polynucleobacter sp. AP-Kolm-20A-A1]
MNSIIDNSQEVARFCLDRGLVDLVRYKQAETQSKVSSKPLYDVLVSSHLIDDHKAKEAVAAYLDLPVVTLADIHHQVERHLDAIPINFAIDNRIIPFDESEQGIKVAIAEPSALRSISSVRLIAGKNVSAYVVSPIEMEGLIKAVLDGLPKNVRQANLGINKMTPKGDKSKLGAQKANNPMSKPSTTKAPAEAVDLHEEGQGNHVIAFVNDMIIDAIKQGSSDIHIEMYKDSATARYRVDGVLKECRTLKEFLFANYPAVTTRIKIMASLDISERRLPQDGAITITLPEGRDVDLRVSILPTVFGERVVMRILDRDGISFDLDKLGFPEKEYADVVSAFESSQGMVLVTGPTGSGKSTTLYGALKRLNKPGVNILTAEDPVEFTIDGVGQVQIRDDIGLTFASALRSFLRQDPEIILVGEIRDKETADISIKAALTGHMVLSTLHANDSVSTVVRLINMGIPGYLIGAALTLVIAQRLARKICPACKQPHEGNHEAILLNLGFTPDMAKAAKPYHGAGCEKCNHTGYKGRQGIYEVLKISEAMRTAIVSEDRRSLKQIAENDGFRSMQAIGRQMIMDGILTIEEYQNNLVFN